MPVLGVGVDLVDVERFTRAVLRTPRLLDRVLTEAEQTVRRPERLAARFAAKEALAKALGAPRGLGWHDAEVVAEPSSRPRFLLRGTVAEAAARLGVTSWHLSLSHDAGLATAFVVLEGS